MIEVSRPSSGAVPVRPLVVVLGGGDADRLDAVAALPLADAILIGHGGPIPDGLAPRARRLEDTDPATVLPETSRGALLAELKSTAIGRAFAVALRERREHLLFLDLDGPSDLGPDPAPDRAGATDHAPAIIAAVETLMRLLDQRGHRLRIDSLNRDCPVSLALGCGILPPSALSGETGVSVVVVPLIPRDCDAAVENFALWNDPQCFPRDSRGSARTDLAFVFNCPPEPELERRLREAFAASPAARRCFRELRVAFLGLEGEDDRYIRRASGPMPRYGYKAGPNLLFFGALAQLKRWGYPGFAALMEVDCRPLRRGWLDSLDRLARRHPDAWVIGSIYRGHGLLGDNIKRHLNGNALYAVGSTAFHDFLDKGYLAWLQAQVTRREADLAFDTAWERFLDSADPERANSAEWRVVQHVLPRFVTCDEIANIAGEPEIRGQIAFSRETLRRAFPAACIVHGPIAPQDRNLDLVTLPEALSRMAFDNAIGHGAEGLRIEEWLAAPGLSRRGAASWTFASPGPETVGGLLLGAADGLMGAGMRIVAHVAIRADRRTMLRFALVPDGETWRAASRDIFLQPLAPKRFRIELTLAEAARYVAFRLSPASADDGGEALTVDFDELRFARLGEDGRHEGGLSLGLTSLAAANYGALSVIGSTPVPPEGSTIPPVAAPEPEPAPATPPVWTPRLALSGPDDAGLCRLVLRDAEGGPELASLTMAEGRIARLVLSSAGDGPGQEIAVPQGASDLLPLAGTENAERAGIEALAVHWDQVKALVAGNADSGGDALSPDAVTAIKAEPTGLLAAIDPLWHRADGRAEIAATLAAVLDARPRRRIRFSGLFRLLRRIAMGSDPEAAWQIAQTAIAGRGAPLPRGVAVAVAGQLGDHGRRQAFANHLSGRGEHDAAAEICRMSIAAGDAPRDAWLVLARSEAALGAMEASGVALRLGVARHPSDAALLMDLVKWYGRRGDTDRAGETTAVLARMPQDNPDVIAEIAARLILSGRHDEAIAFGEQHLARGPDLRVALSMLAAASALGRQADALRLARAAIALGALPSQVAGPLIPAAARLWEVGDAAGFAEEVLTRDGASTLLPALLHDRLQIFEAQRDEEAIDAAGVAELLDWIHARQDLFAGDLKLRALALAAGCGLREALQRGLLEWRPAMAPYDAARIGRALLAGAGEGKATALSDEELAGRLIAGAPSDAGGHCERLIAAAILPDSPALRLAAQLAGFELGDPDLVRHHGLLQPDGAFDRPLPLWPLRGAQGVWPRDPMQAFAGAEIGRAARRLGRAAESIDWPKIAVVLPSLNQGATIEDSLLSVLNQGYPKIEVTVVDGGSTDGTLDILARHAGRVRTIVARGLGQSAALALGFRDADADLLCWLNTDDLLLPGAFFAVAATWLASPVDVIVGDCLHFRDSDVVDLVVADRKRPPLDLGRLLDVERNWLAGRYFTQPEVFFSRSAYEKAGDTVDAGLGFAMDYDLWLRMASAGLRSVSLPRPLAAFRRHGRQKTRHRFEAFAELVAVRNRHPSARRPAARPAELPRGPLALCPWDAPAGSPLAALLAGGKPVRLNPEAEAAVMLLPPGLAREHPGPVLDILGLGGPLPEGAKIAEQLRLRGGSSATAWIWAPETDCIDKLCLSRHFARVVPTDTVAGAYLHHLDPRLPVLPECALLDPRRTASPPPLREHGEATRWLHLALTPDEAFGRLLPRNARILRPAALFRLAQGDGETARGFIASFGIVSMTAPGRAIPGLARDAAALGCRTLVVTPSPGVSETADHDGILLAPAPRSEAEAKGIVEAARRLAPAPHRPAAHDLLARAFAVLAAHELPQRAAMVHTQAGTPASRVINLGES